MKKNFFWSILACIVAMAMSVTFVACGDDDDSTSNPTSNTQQGGNTQTIVGNWKAYIPNSGDGLVSRYQHQLVYTFQQDGTFRMLTAFYTPDTPNAQVESAISSANTFDDIVAKAQFQGELNVVYFQGNYSLKGDSITLSIKDYSEYNWEGKWTKLYQSNTPMAEPVFIYNLAGGKLTLKAVNEYESVFNNHHILVGELSSVGAISYFPSVPDMAPIVGQWTLDGDTHHNTTLIFDVYGSITYCETLHTGGTSPNTKRQFDNTEVNKVGRYTYENDMLSVTYTYTQTVFLMGDQRVDTDMENIEEADRKTDIDPIVISGNKMTLWEQSWTKQE